MTQHTEPTPPFILALDVGTSSVRAILFDAAGNTVPKVVAQHTYGLTATTEGEVSVDASHLLDVLTQTIDETLQLAGSRAQHIAAVATDTFWHGIMGVDSNNNPLTSVITWEDTRAYGAVAELRSRLDEKAVHDRTGARFHASYWPAKLLWLQKNQPDIFARVSNWISFGEYVHRKFLDRSICSLSMASGTGMLRTRARAWDEELLAALQVDPRHMPPLGDCRDAIRGLTTEYANRWPALRDVPWFPAIGDGAAACIGSGCADSKNWSLTIGTSSALRVVVEPEGVVPPMSLWLYLIDGKRAVLGGALSEGGNLISWLDATLKWSSLQDAEAEAQKLPPDGHGLTILPLIAGERSPGWHSESRMNVAGLSLRTSPPALLRACFEALAYRLLVVYQDLRRTLQVESSELTPRVLASGGTLLNSALLQSIVADTFATPLYPSLDLEASARGVALLALEALGTIPDSLQVTPRLTSPIMPDTTRGAIYRKAADRQQQLYSRLLVE